MKNAYAYAYAYAYFFAYGFAKVRAKIEIRQKRWVGHDRRPKSRRRNIDLTKGGVLNRQVDNVFESASVCGERERERERARARERESERERERERERKKEREKDLKIAKE